MTVIRSKPERHKFQLIGKSTVQEQINLINVSNDIDLKTRNLLEEKKWSNRMKQKNDLVIYKTEDGAITINVEVRDETVWLSQKQMIELFGRDQSFISRHINNEFKESEVDQKSNM